MSGQWLWVVDVAAGSGLLMGWMVQGQPGGEMKIPCG